MMVMTHNEMLMRAYNVLGVKEDAEDAVQNAFLWGLENGIEPTMALEKTISAVRRNTRYGTQTSLIDETLEGPDIDWRTDEMLMCDDELSNAKVAFADAALLVLSRRQQHVMHLVGSGMSAQEIANTLGVTKKSIQMIIVRARRRLNKRVTQGNTIVR